MSAKASVLVAAMAMQGYQVTTVAQLPSSVPHENAAVVKVEKVEEREPMPDAATRTAGDDNPKPEWVRGTCPECGGLLVNASYFIDGRGYVTMWECWEALAEEPTCDYRRVL